LSTIGPTISWTKTLVRNSVSTRLPISAFVTPSAVLSSSETAPRMMKAMPRLNTAVSATMDTCVRDVPAMLTASCFGILFNPAR
jgi:hypothetical protein